MKFKYKNSQGQGTIINLAIVCRTCYARFEVFYHSMHPNRFENVLKAKMI